ncbi:response regulator transcription factor [Paraburkholderia adhaesiva]|uniref:response regulator transcription factor n=1 Tax=Paraburkholderia adhaesiva TaxID=2883244 RepID=UPI001F1F6855|nr:response regulator transcription factor [Paraburkholderia adhaesiva]
MKIKVVIADHHPVVIAGLSQFLGDIGTIDVIGVTENYAEIVNLVSSGNCNVLIMGLSSPGGTNGDGLRSIADVRQQFPALKIIVYTMISNQAIIKQLLQLGVRSVINKSEKMDHLIVAIHAVYAGAIYFPAAGDATSNATNRALVAGSRFLELSKRELEVIGLLASGMSMSEIAEYKHRSIKTVSAQKRSAMKRLGVSREVELYQYAFESALEFPDQLKLERTASSGERKS